MKVIFAGEFLFGGGGGVQNTKMKTKSYCNENLIMNKTYLTYNIFRYYFSRNHKKIIHQLK
jgi:hypothetical protein